MTQLLPITTEAGEPPTGYVLDIFGPGHLGENLAPKVALLKAVLGFDEHTGHFKKPLPPKPFCRDIFHYIFFGKVRCGVQRGPSVCAVLGPTVAASVGVAKRPVTRLRCERPNSVDLSGTVYLPGSDVCGRLLLDVA